MTDLTITNWSSRLIFTQKTELKAISSARTVQRRLCERLKGASPEVHHHTLMNLLPQMCPAYQAHNNQVHGQEAAMWVLSDARLMVKGGWEMGMPMNCPIIACKQRRKP